jgi:hypothetical protein
MTRALLALPAVLTLTALAVRPSPAADLSAEELFEARVRPVFVQRCQECHGPEEQWSGLRLDSRAGVLKGGDGGPVVVPGKPGESELLRRVTAKDEYVRMPPPEAGEALTQTQIRAISRWIERGAPWPDSPAPSADKRRAAWDKHWAFQPVERPPLPQVRDETWAKTPIDRFTLHRLEADGLKPSPAADRRTLIRRATYDLTGLPPTPEEVERFVRDDKPDAYARLIDRLLASPRYGEQWGRYWLDVARYSDTKGYVYAREERFFVHASTYRDWVVRALNDDMPYDRFVLLQLAADQAAPKDPGALAAMGFLTLGRRFLGVTPDIIDDRIDVVTRGLMGLTVTCARCHDHKFDPIPTEDYYALYGVFQNCVQRLAPVPRQPNVPPPSEEFQKELRARRQKLRETMAARRAEAGDRIRARIDEYLLAQRELEKYPDLAFSLILSKEDLIPSTVHRWRAFLARAKKEKNPVFIPYFAFARLTDEQFARAAAETTRQLRLSKAAINPRVAEAFASPPASAQEVAERYGQIFAEIDKQWRERCEAAKREKLPPPKALPDPDDEALRQVLYGPNSPCVIPDEPIVNIEFFFDTGTTVELWKLQGEVDRWLLKAPKSAPRAGVLTDRAHPVEPRVFRRGNPSNKGAVVPRRFLQVIAGPDRHPFSHGSGRLEMAQAIVDPENPLTARVWVNRVWMHHFGNGLVNTPSDFGMRAETPSHPQLLDWLADEFVAGGWSTKRLHRAILLSATYRQQSRGPADPALRRRALERDPQNRLLWRMNARRLSFEQFRDTLVALSGELDDAMGGKAVAMFASGEAGFRRSIYGLVDRQYVSNAMTVFDFANPDAHSPRRSETTVPQQALFALNHPFVAGRARALAGRLPDGPVAAAADRATRLYQLVLQRDPTSRERQAALAFVAAAQRAAKPAETKTPAEAAWSYGYGAVDEGRGRVKTFQPLPYFEGSAWQGGPQWPDAKLGWARLTARGGHAGNDLQHAVIRRWTASAAGAVTVKSEIAHEVAAGDGVRYWVISSRHGILQSAVVHNTRRQVDLGPIAVQPGDTLDFVVDYHANLNSDQFLWAPTITTTGDSEAVASWNAARDFAGRPPNLLAPWEQLAQLLLISNEMMFVD